MGLVEFKSKVSGDVVKAEFPLAEMPDLVSFEGDASGHMAKADFLSQFTQVLPELPKTDTANVPTVPVSSTPGNPVAAPAPAQSFGERLESKINVLANYLSSELGTPTVKASDPDTQGENDYYTSSTPGDFS